MQIDYRPPHPLTLGGSGNIVANTTTYLGFGLSSATLSNIAPWTVPFDCMLRGMAIAASGNIGTTGAHTWIMTLRTGLAVGSLAPSAYTFTIAGAVSIGAAAINDSIFLPKGTLIDLQIAAAVGTSTRAAVATAQLYQ